MQKYTPILEDENIVLEWLAYLCKRKDGTVPRNWQKVCKYPWNKQTRKSVRILGKKMLVEYMRKYTVVSVKAYTTTMLK